MPGTPADRPIDLYCPRCQSTGAVHFRSLRSSAVYLCRDCEHQWEIEGEGNGVVADILAHEGDLTSP